MGAPHGPAPGRPRVELAGDRPAAGRPPSLAPWPFLQANAHRWVPERTWVRDGAAALLLPRPGGATLVGAGDPAGLAPLLADVDAPVVRAMLTRGTWARVPAAHRTRLGLRPGRPWDWLHATAAPPVQPGQERVRELTGPGRLAAVYRALAAAYPERGRHAEDERLSWWGWQEDDGELAGVVGADVPVPDARAAGAGVHLQALAVRPDRRRQGIAAAMTAALTRWGLAHAPVVHLGIWSDNDAARRLYTALGYRTGHRVESLEP